MGRQLSLSLIFSKPMFPVVLRHPVRNVLDPNGPYKHESDKNNKYLSVTNFGILSVVCCLSSVACLQPTPAYVED